MDPNDDDHHRVLIQYPSLFLPPSNPYLKSHVQLEFEARAENEPSLDRDIRSLVADVFSNAVWAHSIRAKTLANRCIYFNYKWLDYTAMAPGSFMLIPKLDRITSWNNDYQRFSEDMIYGEVPRFTELLGTLEILQSTLNSIRE